MSAQASPLAGQLAVEEASVVQAGQAVLLRQALQLRLHLQALAVVAGHPDQVFALVHHHQVGADFRCLVAAVEPAHFSLKNRRTLILLRLAHTFQPLMKARE